MDELWKVWNEFVHDERVELGIFGVRN